MTGDAPPHQIIMLFLSPFVSHSIHTLHALAQAIWYYGAPHCLELPFTLNRPSRKTINPTPTSCGFLFHVFRTCPFFVDCHSWILSSPCLRGYSLIPTSSGRLVAGSALPCHVCVTLHIAFLTSTIREELD